ncbi:autotransporter outer membrane beta-barrel domain-containing protein [Aquamicrobium zhengzhouense]|uniref:Autotransporter outer membrane beta-barrel domain-containing protein n=1 Tax=Aquamicrobium zhengzhouense TaxID=2781738 RepID=A0ABS0SGI6_9HYPH|nr:autotransporter outer membrane beta-barrel domain-containing protein [Aquamicrobium zhengzhouense]MBI1622386.1 autotransporter outer membrane beta-barrel domain-containing protein [Aquamicrobium zhengzhouense]
MPAVPEIPGTPDAEVPLYRPEVPLYAPVPAIARELGLAFLGTLHERVGDQMSIRLQPDQENYFNGAWLRFLGESGRNRWTGSADVQIRNARLWGIQGGLDLYRAEHSNGHRDHFGIYGGYATHRSRVEWLCARCP